MVTVELENNSKKEEFLNIAKSNISRSGIDELLNWLVTTDFFIAPSSTKFHGNFEGGLCEHSLNVYYSLKMLVENYKKQFPEFNISEESIAMCGLFHDLCKVNFYKTYSRNVKNETTNEWENKQEYKVEDLLGMGHGEGSMYIIQSFMKLERFEALAIRWHMGEFDKAVKGGEFAIETAKEQNAIVTLLHLADIWASDFMEEIIK